jgi:hypothetical protein
VRAPVTLLARPRLDVLAEASQPVGGLPGLALGVAPLELRAAAGGYGCGQRLDRGLVEQVDDPVAHGTSGVPDHAPFTGGESNAWLSLAIACSRAWSAITHRAPHRALGEV